jgi:hypothetical protein
MVLYGSNFLLWLQNTTADNRGDSTHWLFWRFSQISILFPVVTFFMTYLAQSSYGTRAQVYISWSGSATYDTMTPAKADNYYLMFRDTAAIQSTTFTVKAMLTQRGYDTNYSSAMTWSYVFASFDLIVAIASFWVFSNSYKIANDNFEKRWEHVYDRAGYDENGYDAEGYNESGCYHDLDRDGNPCPASEEAAEDVY